MNDPTGEQLYLPIDELKARMTLKTPKPKRIFCNRDLRLSEITWVGFDMDYTLAIYNQPEMDKLSIRATVEKMVAKHGYPEFILDVPYLLDFPVRGLLVDKRFGNVLKVDRYKQVCKGYHGLRELTREELQHLYHSKKLRPATPARYHWIDTLYALSEAAVYVASIEVLEARKHAVDYGRLFTDIRASIDEAHRDGTILDAVSSNLPQFVDRDPQLPLTLHRLRSSGKKLFILTNSRLSYTEKMMNYLLGGALAEYPSWRNYFDIAVVAASKPAFFQERRPLLQRDGESTKPAEFPLERGRVYEGGNLVEFERALNVTGNQVLYVADHIYGDILRSKKDSAWRTIMVIQELENEVAVHEECKAEFEQLEHLEDVREHVDEDVRFYQARLKEISRVLEGREKSSRTSLTDLDGERTRLKRSLERAKATLRQLEEELFTLERTLAKRFHAYWGELMKEGNEQSIFGSQVEEYACLYTSRVSNLLACTPHQAFRAPRDVMAHEVE